MVEPEKKDCYKTADLEDTVRNLREENAKLLQLLRSQGLLIDPPNGRSNDSFFSTANSSTDTAQITLNHSDLTSTNNTTTTTNQINHQQITNHGSTNQQNFNDQTIHGNQSNITPNFNTVIQSTTQPFVQNNSNTLVQNNTNVIQPINLVNFNNVSLDSIHSFFASQNNVVYLPQTSATTTTTTTSSLNAESIPSTTQSILSSSEHQVSIQPKPSILHPNQELVPVIPKMKTELYESYTKQFSSTTSSNDTTNLLDNDSNDPKQKYPRPIRPRPSSRGHALQSYKSLVVHGTRSASLLKNSSSLSYSPSSATNNYVPQSSTDHPPPLIHSKSLDLSVPSTTNTKSTKNRLRNRKKPAPSSTNPTPLPIAPNLGRPLAPAPANVSRPVTSNNPITKRSQKKVVKRNSKSLVQHHSESILQQNASSPINSFAESISGLLENFDQELMASNFLSQATVTTTTTTTTSNLLSDSTNALISSNTNIIQTFDQMDQTTMDRQESYYSMSTLNEFNPRLETETILTQPTGQDFNVENEQITSFMDEEDMRIVEMNFDENAFLKQFDLDDVGIKFNVPSDQNLFANLLSTNNDLMSTPLSQQQLANETPILSSNPPPPSGYSGSSLMNSNVVTRVVPLGSQHQQTSQANTLITNINVMRLLPEEGVQLTARHIEPSQVATYESVKYQDILDDLVMVTDQDVLRHVQATADGDSSIVAEEFSFALLEATNDMIKNSNLQMFVDNATALTDLQYSYPIESENVSDHQQEILSELQQQEQPTAIAEKLQSQPIPAAETTTNALDDSVINTSITDLSSILQFQSIQSPAHQDMSTVELITPIRPTKIISSKSPDQSIDFESLLPPSKLVDSPPNDSTQTYSPISDTFILSSNSLQEQSRPMETAMSPRPCILFEPISSSSNPPSPMKSSQNEMIIDSGRLDDSHSENTDLINHDEQIEELLRDSTNKPYEIIENQGQTPLKNHLVIADINQLIEQIEASETDPKRVELLEQTFSRYQEKYQLHLRHQQKISTKKSQEQSLTIPPVKLKLNSIYSQQTLKMKEERQSPSPPPPPPPSNHQTEDQPPPPVERPSLKITIRTKLPTSVPSPKQKTPNKKKPKSKKKKSHHHHQHQQSAKKVKTIADQLETEYAGLTRFERPLAQLYHQQSPPTSDETFPKDETVMTSLPPPPLSRSESQSSSTLHSGFIIDEQTPPSSITSNEHKQSPPPLLLTQTKAEKVRNNYSHLFNYDTNHEHQSNDSFVTPPPEIDLNPQQQHKQQSYENFCSFSNSPNKQRHQQRKSSVTSSSSSRSITTTDYAIDTQALEPVSPTPISTSKQKHSRNSSASSANYNDVSPSYFDHQQARQTKDYHSKKSSSSSSSSNRASRPTSSSHIYPQSRSLSNHNYRPAPEPPLLPPVIPPPPSAIHLDPYAQSYHHPFASRAAPPPAYFNFPFPHPFLNPHSTSAPPHYHSHSHHPSMKYPPHHHPHHHHHHHSSHGYPTHQQQYSYHPHLQRQPQYNNSNYMSSRDHHSFDR